MISLLWLVVALMLSLEGATPSHGFTHPVDYCSRPSPKLEADRKIPTLPAAHSELQLELMQIHTMFRHGARTPAGGAANTCWPKQRERPEVWTCEYGQAYMSGEYTSDANAIRARVTPQNSEAAYHPHSLKFPKRYDVHPSDQVLNGACMQGQLIEPGFEQCSVVADALFTAYFENARKLFSAQELVNNPDLVYFRSTDMERTLNTGGLILSGVLERLLESGGMDPNLLDEYKIPVHTMDMLTETLFMDRAYCYEAHQILEKALQSDEAIAMNKKHAYLYEVFSNATGIAFDDFQDDRVIDCYMSPFCTDRDDIIPPELMVTDESKEGTLGFDLWRAVETELAFPLLWNNSQLSRCYTSNLFEDLLGGINAAETEGIGKVSSARNAKWVLYSAHDTSLMRFLASTPEIYDSTWPPYASLITLEVYFSAPKNQSYFRYSFNSEDLTGKFAGCAASEEFISDGVCPLSVFVNYVTGWMNAKPVNDFHYWSGGSSGSSTTGVSGQDWLYGVIGLVIGIAVGVGVLEIYRRYFKVGMAKDIL